MMPRLCVALSLLLLCAAATAVPHPSLLMDPFDRVVAAKGALEPQLKTCTERCTELPPWFPQTMQLCDLQNTTHDVTECWFSSITTCAIREMEFGVQYPGPCGCPNYCHEPSGNGQCVDGECSCSAGWTGADCASVDCKKQKCSGHGECAAVSGLDTCLCDDGWTGADCSIATAPLPAVKNAVPSTQYTSDDEYGNDHPVFNTSTIAQIAIELSDESLQYLLDPENQQTKKYQDAEMWFHNDVATERIESVGFRIKGGVSRTFAKKTWKISFNEFVKGRTWYGLKKLVLKGMSFDPACTREAASADVLYSVNSKTQRYSFAQLRVNGIDFGLVIMLEYIDKIYLDTRFGNHDGLLYKCVGDFEYLGTDPATYAGLEIGGGKYQYDPKTDAAKNFTLLRDLIVVLNKSSDKNFAKDISEILDVDSFLRALAMEVLTGQSDGTWNANNYYLYYDYAVNKFRYFRHDLDLAFGLFDNFPGYDFANSNIWTWEEGGRGYRLPQRVLAQPEFQEVYAFYLERLMDAFVSPTSSLIARLAAWHAQLETPFALDYWHRLDYLWTEADYALSLNATVVHELPVPFWMPVKEVEAQGMQQFIRQRYDAARVQLREGPPA